MTLLDGKAVAAQIRAELKVRAEAFERARGRKVGLAVLLVGNDPASQVYVRNKIKACEEVGIRSFSHHLPDTISQKEAEELVGALAQDDMVDGILVQLPLPEGLDTARLLKAIPPEKDVDGFSPYHLGRLAEGDPDFVACTPRGVMELLARYRISPRGKRAVVVGRSNTVGRPMALLLLNADATVTVCHSRTVDLKEECRRADLLVVAIGKPKFVGADMVKEGAVVVDVGINRDENGKLCGDVDFEAVKDKVSYITPVPGGVGPMTVAMLLTNVCDAAERK